MGLKKCADCRKQISTRANVCPHCGAVFQKRRIGIYGCLGWTIGICILGGAVTSAIENKVNESHQNTVRRQQSKQPIAVAKTPTQTKSNVAAKPKQQPVELDLQYTVLERKLLRDKRIIHVSTAQIDQAAEIAENLMRQESQGVATDIMFYNSKPPEGQGQTPGKDLESIRYEWRSGSGLTKTQDNRVPGPRPERDPKLPDYEVLFQVRATASKRVFGDVLVDSFSRQTPADVREETIRGIARQENIDDAALFSTRDAYQASISASFLEQHPDALRIGFLGSLEGDKFTPGETSNP